MLKALWHKHRKRQRVKPPRKSQTENPSPATLYEAVCLYLNSAISRPGAIEDKKMSVSAFKMAFQTNEFENHKPQFSTFCGSCLHDRGL